MADKRKYKQLAIDIAGGSTIQAAMVKAGYSPAQARKGRAGLPEGVKAELRKRLGEKWAELVRAGKQAQSNPDELKAGLVGALVTNVASGTDKAAQSLKMLGSLRDVNAFGPETQGNFIIIEMPKQLYADDQPAPVLVGGPLKFTDEGYLPAPPEGEKGN